MLKHLQSAQRHEAVQTVGIKHCAKHLPVTTTLILPHRHKPRYKPFKHAHGVNDAGKPKRVVIFDQSGVLRDIGVPECEASSIIIQFTGRPGRRPFGSATGQSLINQDPWPICTIRPILFFLG